MYEYTNVRMGNGRMGNGRMDECTNGEWTNARMYELTDGRMRGGRMNRRGETGWHQVSVTVGVVLWLTKRWIGDMVGGLGGFEPLKH